MLDVFEGKLLGWINSNGLFDGCGRVLLAVSGGADSVAMAYGLCRLRAEGRLNCELVIGHINHCLRGVQSDADEAFVKEWAQTLGVDVRTIRADAAAYANSHKLSIETAARKLRLKSLIEMAERSGCRRIATAHHADDQAETVIHRLMRGTGFRGLCGIKPISVVYGGVFVRPMLNVRRDEVIAYCQQNHLHWREDASNASLTFTRNRIRHRLLPALQSSHDLTEPLAGLAQAAQTLQQRFDKTFPTVMEELGIEQDGFRRIVFDREKLRNCSVWTFYEICRQSLVTLGAGLRNYSRAHFDAISEMIGQPRAKADFPGSIEIRVEGGRVIFCRTDAAAGLSGLGEVNLEIGEMVMFGCWKINSRLLNRADIDLDEFMKTKDSYVEWFDADNVVGPIVIRPRQDGDRFRPIGGRGNKKVARFLIDAGLDREAKQNVFVIADSEKIMWVVPVRMSGQAMVTAETQTILEIKLNKQELPHFSVRSDRQM